MNKWDIKKQRELADLLVYKLTKKKLKRSKSGRPFVEKSMDVSVSHKDNFVSAAVVPAPYRIGIDVEYIKTRLRSDLFLGPVITSRELPSFKKFCEDNNFFHSSGIVVFWSIKESFFKCLDYDLKPGKISVLKIAKNGEIRFGFSNEIKALFKKRGLKFCLTKTVLQGEFIFSQTIMKKVSPRALSASEKRSNL